MTIQTTPNLERERSCSNLARLAQKSGRNDRVAISSLTLREQWQSVLIVQVTQPCNRLNHALLLEDIQHFRH
jgi:hypothetical protein